MIDLIKKAIEKFQLNLTGLNILTEAASGNYKCTPLIAALAGANVYAIGRDSQYGKFAKISADIKNLARKAKTEDKITFIKNLNSIDLSLIDIVTNTGFLRPINGDLINKLSPKCVIPLMYEPWEFRQSDLDIELCAKRGIKVYGTNESDPRLKTMQYIGYIVLYFLLKVKRTPFRSKVLLIGSPKFNASIETVLKSLNYFTVSKTVDELLNVSVTEYDVIVLTEFVKDLIIIGDLEKSLISKNAFTKHQVIIHIAGNVDIEGVKSKIFPKKPAKATYMSFTTDFIDPVALFDLQAAGLKVGEGMIIANNLNLHGDNYRQFMETHFPALSFHNHC